MFQQCIHVQQPTSSQARKCTLLQAFPLVCICEVTWHGYGLMFLPATRLASVQSPLILQPCAWRKAYSVIRGETFKAQLTCWCYYYHSSRTQSIISWFGNFFLDLVTSFFFLFSYKYRWMQQGSYFQLQSFVMSWKCIGFSQLGFFKLLNPDFYNCLQKWYMKPNVVSPSLCYECFPSIVFTSNVHTMCVCVYSVPFSKPNLEVVVLISFWSAKEYLLWLHGCNHYK